MSVSASKCMLVLVLGLVGCSSSPPEVSCMQKALQQDGLAAGEVVFQDGEGKVLHLSQRWSVLRQGAMLPMASLTKLLIADEVRRRVERGDYSLDAPIASILHQNGLNSKAGALTLRQLIQHQGGLDRLTQDPLFAGGDPDCSFAASLVLRRAPEWAAGEKVIYSNAGYCVLGEVLKLDSVGLPPGVRSVLHSPLGAAGGWRSSLADAYVSLAGLLPLHPLPSAVTLPDGSYYAYAWRHWSKSGYPEWSHFGRLRGILLITATDGKSRLLVAYFRGDPDDVDAVSERAMQDMWACVPLVRS